MCGIVGVLAYGELEDKAAEKARQEAMIYFSTVLLQLTQTRGPDATGLAVLFDNCDYMGLKMGISAAEFVARFGETERDYEGFMNIWRRKTAKARAVIGHCRKPSTGGNAGPEDNNNNHPIKVGDTLVVHNGTLNNADKIFKKLSCGRDGKVDSEAIARLVHHYTKNGSIPFTTEMLQEIGKRLSGAATTLAFCANNPFQVAGTRDGRPMEIAVVRPLKLVLVASEDKFLKAALTRYNMESVVLSPNKGMPRLNKDAVVTGNVIERRTVLFDLRQDITDTTIVKDVVEQADIELGTKRIWGAGTKTTTTVGTTVHNSAANTNTGTGGQKKRGTEVGSTAVNNSTPGTSKTSGGTGAGSSSGMAFDRDKGRFSHVRGDDARTTDHLGSVEADAEDGSITEVGGTGSGQHAVNGEKKDTGQSAKSGGSAGNRTKRIPKEDIPLDKTSDNVDECACDTAAIRIHEVQTPEVGTEDSTDAIIAMHRAEVIDAEVVEIDMSTPDPKVMEKATAAADKIERLTDNFELMDRLSFAGGIGALRAIQPFAIANRIQKYAFRNGFYQGFMTSQATTPPPLPVKPENGLMQRYRQAKEREQAKRKKAEATIRTLKNMVLMLMSSQPNKLYFAEMLRHKSVNGIETPDAQCEVDYKIIKNVFPDGDLAKVPEVADLKRLAGILLDEEKKLDAEDVVEEAIVNPDDTEIVEEL
jgi:hypothetical protein